jgi:signal peptidase I
MLVRIVIVVLVTIGIVAALFFGLTRRYTVHTKAMEPTFRNGDHVAVFRFWDTFSSPHRKDVVVFTPPPSAASQCHVSGKQVRRVIGLPGETVSEQTGRVLIDGKPLEESYVKRANRDSLSAAWHVPAGEYFLMGDDRSASCDSRTFGAVPKNDIAGRIVLTFWPVDRVSAG